MSDSAKQKVLAVYPEMEYVGKIGWQAGLWNPDHIGWKLMEQGFEPQVWEDFAAKLPAPPAPQGSGEHKLVAEVESDDASLSSTIYRAAIGPYKQEINLISAELPRCEGETIIGSIRNLKHTVMLNEGNCAALEVALAEVEAARDKALTLGAEQVLEIQELRQVVKKYRLEHKVVYGCKDGELCGTCASAELLEPKAKPTQQGDKE